MRLSESQSSMDRWTHAEPLQGSLVGMAGVLGTAIGVMHGFDPDLARRHCLPADHLAAEQVDEHR